MSRALAISQLSSRPQALRAEEPGPKLFVVNGWVPALQDRARAVFPAGMTRASDGRPIAWEGDLLEFKRGAEDLSVSQSMQFCASPTLVPGMKIKVKLQRLRGELVVDSQLTMKHFRVSWHCKGSIYGQRQFDLTLIDRFAHREGIHWDCQLELTPVAVTSN